MNNPPKKYINTYLLVETIGVFLALSACSVYLGMSGVRWYFQLPLFLLQGLWFYRLYILGHEASHRKLFPNNVARNDFWGGLILVPIMTPINIYRKIHMFHHGFNRKDHHTSALDTYVTRHKPNWLIKAFYHLLWYIGVFMGGWFLHSLVSVILFLFIPPSVSVRISPAFKGWTMRDQLKAIGLFSLGVGFHVAVYLVGGTTVYLYSLGYPMLAFAWVLSLFVYIFHYDTTIGNETRFNVRSLRHVPFFSWILMNFNEHATHHQHPNIPWYELPAKRTPLPEKYHHQNQNTDSLAGAILNQLKGPKIVYVHENKESES
ncbi:fatty acid desaturase family protein [Telluribacter humicola]|uniref:fatty acid desaturase family protein n=1 Tax=Telluribacter humicola TaxID=1720261 RepID=UPI001A967525|nr:fatty acid desaturase [Telluribacter humicola]